MLTCLVVIAPRIKAPMNREEHFFMDLLEQESNNKHIWFQIRALNKTASHQLQIDVHQLQIEELEREEDRLEALKRAE